MKLAEFETVNFNSMLPIRRMNKMIKSIKIQNQATYGNPGETLSELSKFNFIYGSNGTGKTTISRVIADPERFNDCSVIWQNDNISETLVYNRDFVKKNFDQSPDLQGIFTLGEQDKNTLKEIKDAKESLISLKEDGIKLRNTLNGEDKKGGKKSELEMLEADFEEKCWNLKTKYDGKFQGAFAGVRGKKVDFKNRILSEKENNTADLESPENLEKRAATVFVKNSQEKPLITKPDYSVLLNLELNSILKKKVIGKKDIDIAAIIQKLNNSDWVDQGRVFYDSEDRICPFCQQKTNADFTTSLNAYFDEAFKKDIADIKTLLANYKTNIEALQEDLQSIIDKPSSFLDLEKFKANKELLDLKIQSNLQKIEKKLTNASQCIELDSLDEIAANIGGIIDLANKQTKEHNAIVSNLSKEKRTLTAQIWKFLLEKEIKIDLTTYCTAKNDLDKAIDNLNSQLKKKREEYKSKETEIKALEKNVTSIQPTINEINKLLQSFGFTSFSLAPSNKKGFYQLLRPGVCQQSCHLNCFNF